MLARWIEEDFPNNTHPYLNVYHPSTPALLNRADDEHSLLRLCCDLYERTGKAWLFELETVAIILKYKWCVRPWVFVDMYSPRSRSR